MFWVLVAMAVVVFAPCVLLPVWRDYQALQYTEQVERVELERARAELERQKRHLTALQSDPATIARVARRELRYRNPKELAIPVRVAVDEPVGPAPVELTPVEPPEVIASIVDRLPDTDYDRLFCPGPPRTILMCLAGGLVLSALVLYSPRRTHQGLSAGD